MNPSYHNNCTNCPLHKCVTSVGIGGDGAENPDILIVLEAPGRNEDIHNVAAYPSGAAALLRDICQKMNEEGDISFRFSYVVRCACLEETAAGWMKPRPPAAKEISKCIPWLHEEIAMCKPKAIVLMGGTVVKAVLGNSTKLGDVRGRAIWRGEQVYVPTYHPSNMLEVKTSYGKDYKQHGADQYIEWIVQDLILAARVANGEQKQPEDIEWSVAQNEADAMYGLYECSKLGPEEFFGVDIENNCWDDTEIDSIFKPGMRITHLGLSWKRNQALVIPMDFLPEMPQPAKFRPSYKWQRDFVHALWKVKARHSGQNYSYDEVAMHLRYGVSHFRPYHDTILMHHLLWSHLPHALAELARVWTPWGGYEEEVKQTVAKMPRAHRGFWLCPFNMVARKNAFDAAITRNLTEEFYKRICCDERLRWIYENITLPVANPLTQMSLHGTLFNVDTCNDVMINNQIMRYKIEEIMRAESPEWQKCEELLECHLELGKSLHRTLLLFSEECGNLEPTKISKKTGVPSTDKEVLAALSEESDLAYVVMKLRSMQTLEEKVFKPLPSWIGWDGRVHSVFKIYGTRTGRLASEEPNAQNWPGHALCMIEAADGNILIVADISQAEIRMIAIVCHALVLLNAFNQGIGPDGKPIDIHCAVGVEMLGLSYEEVKENEDVRRTVKCLAEGQRVLTDRGLVAIQEVTCYDKVWDGESFVEHGGVVFSGVKEVITYAGITATPDHQVWIQDGRSVRLSEAMAQGLELATTGCEGVPIGYPAGYFEPHPFERDEEVQGSMGDMYKVQLDKRNTGGQYTEREESPVPVQEIESEPARSTSEKAAGEIRDDQTEMHKSKTSRLPQLRRERDTLQVHNRSGVRPIYTEESSTRELCESGYRQNEQRRTLRTRESETGSEISKSTEQKNECVGRISGGDDNSRRPVGQNEGGLGRVQSGQEANEKSSFKRNSLVHHTMGETENPVQIRKTYDVTNAGPYHRYTVENHLVKNSVNFGISYGMTEHGLSKRIGKSTAECVDLIAKYFEKMPEVRIELVENTKKELLQYGYIRTIMGRYWHLSDDQKAAFTRIQEMIAKGKFKNRDGTNRDFWDHPIAARALKQAGNCKIQSPTSDLVCLSLIKLEKKLNKMFRTYDNTHAGGIYNGQKADALLSNEIHDSIVVEAKEELLVPIAEVMKECMENPCPPFDMPIPWTADIKYGKTMEKDKMTKLNVHLPDE